MKMICLVCGLKYSGNYRCSRCRSAGEERINKSLAGTRKFYNMQRLARKKFWSVLGVAS